MFTLNVRMADGRHIWTTTGPYFRLAHLAALYQAQGRRALVFPI